MYAFGAGQYEDWFIRGYFAKRKDAERAREAFMRLNHYDEASPVFKVVAKNTSDTDELIEEWENQYGD
jgi:hypothetical protein